MRIYSFFIALILLASCGGDAPSETEIGANSGILESWSISPCDNDSDPYKLQVNISSFKQTNNKTYISLNFPDNCCIEPNPSVSFRNDSLFVLPYSEVLLEECACNCVFTIDLILRNIPENELYVFFKDEMVDFSTDRYPTFPIQYEVINGDTVNRTNKYGARIGYWVDYYDNGQMKSEHIYTVQDRKLSSLEEFSRLFNESGQMTKYHSSDSTLTWHSNGQLASINYTEITPDNNIVKHTREYFSNGQIKIKESATRFAEENRIDGVISASKIDFEFYEDGSPKYLWSKDTTWTWYQNGDLMKLWTSDSLTVWRENGSISESHTHWETSHTADHNLTHYLVYYYNEKERVVKKRFSSDVAVQNGYTNKQYYWEWDDAGNVIEEPETEPDIAALKRLRLMKE